MRELLLSILLFSASFAGAAPAQDGFKVHNGDLTLKVSIGESINYSVEVCGTEVLSPSPLSLSLKDGPVLGRNPRIRKVERRHCTEEIDAPLYRKKSISASYEVLDISLAGGYGVEFRVYPDGVAYRFSTSFKDDVVVESEQVEYRFAEDFRTAVTYVTPSPEAGPDSYRSSFQAQYSIERISSCKGHPTFAFLPLYVDAGEAGRLLITESDVEDYPGMFIKAGEGLSYVAEHPGYPLSFYYDESHARYPLTRADYIARCKGKRTYPWRILIYGKDDVALANNDMVYKTAAPSRLADASWVEGGQAAWDWWNGTRISKVDFVSGMNTGTYKYYVDFAARFGIKYVLIDDGWYSYEENDLLHPIPGMDLEEIVAYAESKGVGILLWAVGDSFEKQIEAVCSKYSAMGVKGFKVDFFDRQDQELVQSIYHMAEVSARYGLTINFHGMYKPTGLSRTWPNVVNYEGVFGLEQLKWTEGDAADMPFHDVMLPFTRGAVGPLDYTPGAMRNATKANFRAIRMDPMSQGTRAHQVALYVIFDSPVTVLCDNLTNYIKEEETTRFITGIPAVPDRLEVLAGAPGQYVLSARQLGDSWWVGGITTWEPRDIHVDFSFLGEGSWKASIFRDGVNADRVGEDYRIDTCTVDASTSMDIHCAPGGGFAIRLEK